MRAEGVREGGGELGVIDATTPSDLDDHAAQWDRLVQSCPFAYPTQTYGWLKAFYRHKCRPKERMHCLFFYRGESLVGVLPLLAGARAHGLGRAPQHYRVPVHDYHTVRTDLLARSDQAAILRAAVRHLSAISPGAPIIRWRKVPETSPVLSAFREDPPGLRLLIRQSGLEHRMAVPGDFGTFVETLGGKFRREVFRQERRLKERAAVTYRLREASRSPEDNLARFMAVEDSGWKGEQGTSILARKGDPALYREAVKQFSENGWLEWNFLEADGQEIAAQFALRLNKTLYLWKVGYRESFANCAPGHLLFLRTVEQACACGDITVVNFMARRRWLRVWEVSPHPIFNFVVYPDGLDPAILATMTEATAAVGYRPWTGAMPAPQSGAGLRPRRKEEVSDVLAE